MAKKGTTKKTTKTVETLDVPVVTMEEKIQSEIIENVTNEISEISAKMEEVQPTEEFIDSVMLANVEQSQELINTEIEKIEKLEKEIQDKIEEIVNNNPDIVPIMKKTNTRFTNYWNGIEY